MVCMLFGFSTSTQTSYQSQAARNELSKIFSDCVPWFACSSGFQPLHKLPINHKLPGTNFPKYFPTVCHGLHALRVFNLYTNFLSITSCQERTFQNIFRLCAMVCMLFGFSTSTQTSYQSQAARNELSV